MNNTVELPVQVVTDILNYLSLQPFKDVAGLINVIGPFYQTALQKQQQRVAPPPGANGNAATAEPLAS